MVTRTRKAMPRPRPSLVKRAFWAERLLEEVVADSGVGGSRGMMVW